MHRRYVQAIMDDIKVRNYDFFRELGRAGRGKKDGGLTCSRPIHTHLLILLPEPSSEYFQWSLEIPKENRHQREVFPLPKLAPEIDTSTAIS